MKTISDIIQERLSAFNAAYNEDHGGGINRNVGKTLEEYIDSLNKKIAVVNIMVDGMEMSKEDVAAIKYKNPFALKGRPTIYSCNGSTLALEVSE